MNWIILDAAAAAVLLLFIIWGWRRGFVATILTLLGTLLVFWAAQGLAQPVAQWTYDHVAKERLVTYVQQRLDETGVDEAAQELQELLDIFSAKTRTLPTLDGLREKLTALLDLVKDKVESGTGGAETSSLQQDAAAPPAGDTRGGTVIPFQQEQTAPQDADSNVQKYELDALLKSGVSPAEALEEVVLQPLAVSALEMAAFLVLFFVLGLLLKLLIRASGLLNHLPLLGGINRLLGGACGLCEGLVIVYAAGVLLRLLAATAGAHSYLTMDLLEQTHLLSRIIFFQG